MWSECGRTFGRGDAEGGRGFDPRGDYVVVEDSKDVAHLASVADIVTCDIREERECVGVTHGATNTAGIAKVCANGAPIGQVSDLRAPPQK